MKGVYQYLYFEVSLVPEAASDLIQSFVLVLNFIVAYLDHQVDVGRLRPHDTQSSARSSMGALVAYVMSRGELLLPLRAGLPDPERYVQEVVAIFLDGIRAERRL